MLTDNDIACEDRDGDGYFNWGVGAMPPSCPAGVRTEPDGDDSAPCLGPMDEFGKLQPLCEEKPIDLGRMGKWKSINVDERVLLSVSKWPSWWKSPASHKIVVSFLSMPWQSLKGISVNVGGRERRLGGRWQRVTMPVTELEKLVFTVSASRPRNILVSWGPQLYDEKR